LINFKDSWGVVVERVEIKTISLPTQMQRVMAIEAEASRDYKAAIIYADGELQASQALREAADTINDSPYAIQLRYMQTLSSITNKNESAVFFPVPMDMSPIFFPDRIKTETPRKKFDDNDAPKIEQEEGRHYAIRKKPIVTN
jgi:hypothetical protein